MSKLVTLITPTGSRPEAFKLCEKFIARQTYKGPMQWIVVDDSPKNPTKCTMDQEYVVGPKEWRPGINTQRYNFDAAIPRVKGDYIFIIEDDDYIAPQYIECYLDMLKFADVVGEGDVTYYSLKVKGFKEMKNFEHASTCQTAFTKKYMPWFERAVHSGEKFPDLVLWQNARVYKHKYMLFHGLRLLVGMKGLPGRGGIGFGHTNTVEFTPDPQSVKLRQLVGDDFDLYKEWL